MIRATTVIATLALLALAACDTPTPPAADLGTEAVTTQPPEADLATRAATIAKAIRANPADAEKILSDNGLTEATFEAMMYDVAADADAAAKYSMLIAE